MYLFSKRNRFLDFARNDNATGDFARSDIRKETTLRGVRAPRTLSGMTI